MRGDLGSNEKNHRICFPRRVQNILIRELYEPKLIPREDTRGIVRDARDEKRRNYKRMY